MAYNDPYRRVRGARGMSAEDGMRDARDTINYQAGVERAMNGGFEPKINAGGRVNVEDWTRMGQAQRLRYAEQAPNEFDIQREGITQPQFQRDMPTPAVVTTPAPQLTTASATVQQGPRQYAQTQRDAPSTSASGATGFDQKTGMMNFPSVSKTDVFGNTVSVLGYSRAATPDEMRLYGKSVATPNQPPAAPLDPNRGYGTYTGRDGVEKKFEPDPQGSISYQGKNGQNYFIGPDVAEKDIPSVVKGNRANILPSVEQMAATTPLEPADAMQPPAARPEAASPRRGKGALRKPKASAEQPAPEVAQQPTPAVAPQQTAPMVDPKSTRLWSPNSYWDGLRSRFPNDPSLSAKPYSLTPSPSPIPNIDGQPVATLRPPAPPPQPPSLSTPANLPPGAQIDPRRRRLLDFGMIPTL